MKNYWQLAWCPDHFP